MSCHITSSRVVFEKLMLSHVVASRHAVFGSSARLAQLEWAKTTFAERKRVLECLQNYILDHQDDIARVASRDSGKPRKPPSLLASPSFSVTVSSAPLISLLRLQVRVHVCRRRLGVPPSSCLSLWGFLAWRSFLFSSVGARVWCVATPRFRRPSSCKRQQWHARTRAFVVGCSSPGPHTFLVEPSAVNTGWIGYMYRLPPCSGRAYGFGTNRLFHLNNRNLVRIAFAMVSGRADLRASPRVSSDHDVVGHRNYSWKYLLAVFSSTTPQPDFRTIIVKSHTHTVYVCCTYSFPQNHHSYPSRLLPLPSPPHTRHWLPPHYNTTTVVEALLAEVMITCEKIRCISSNGEAWLAREERPTGPLVFYKKAYVEYM